MESLRLMLGTSVVAAYDAFESAFTCCLPAFSNETIIPIPEEMATTFKNAVGYRGVDLPVSVRPLNGTTTTRIALIAQDPLRNGRNFGTYDPTDDVVAIGSPFAVHSEDMRSGHAEVYWELVRHIVMTFNAEVYLTDVEKIYYKVQKGSKRVASDLPRSSFDEQLLERELKSFAPDVVVTLGAYAAKKIVGHHVFPLIAPLDRYRSLRSFGECAVLPVVHPASYRYGVVNRWLKKNDRGAIVQYRDAARAVFQVVEPVLTSTLSAGLPALG